NLLFSSCLPLSTVLLAACAGSPRVLPGPLADQAFAASAKTVFPDDEWVVLAHVAVSQEGDIIGYMAALPARHPAVDGPFRRHARDVEPNRPGPGRVGPACRAPDQPPVLDERPEDLIDPAAEDRLALNPREADRERPARNQFLSKLEGGTNRSTITP